MQTSINAQLTLIFNVQESFFSSRSPGALRYLFKTGSNLVSCSPSITCPGTADLSGTMTVITTVNNTVQCKLQGLLLLSLLPLYLGYLFVPVADGPIFRYRLNLARMARVTKTQPTCQLTINYWQGQLTNTRWSVYENTLSLLVLCAYWAGLIGGCCGDIWQFAMIQLL